MDPTHFDQPDPNAQNWGYAASVPAPGRNPSVSSQHPAGDPQYPAAPDPHYQAAPDPHYQAARSPPYPAPHDHQHPAAHAQSPAPRNDAYPPPPSDVWPRKEERIEEVYSPSVAAARDAGHQSRSRNGSSLRYAPSLPSMKEHAPAYPSIPPNPPLTQEYLAKHDSATARSRSVASSSHRSRSHAGARARTPAPSHGSAALVPHRDSRMPADYPPVPALPSYLKAGPFVTVATRDTRYLIYQEQGNKASSGPVDISVKNGDMVVRFGNGEERKERKDHDGDRRRSSRDSDRRYDDDGKKRYDDDSSRHDRKYRDDDRRRDDDRKHRDHERRCDDCERHRDHEERCHDCDRTIRRHDSERSRSIGHRSRR